MDPQFHNLPFPLFVQTQTWTPIKIVWILKVSPPRCCFAGSKDLFCMNCQEPDKLRYLSWVEWMSKVYWTNWVNLGLNELNKLDFMSKFTSIVRIWWTGWTGLIESCWWCNWRKILFCSTSFSTAWMWIQSIAKVFPCIFFQRLQLLTSTNPGPTWKGENRQQLTFHKKKQKTIGEQAQSHLCWQSFSQVLQLNRY